MVHRLRQLLERYNSVHLFTRTDDERNDREPFQDLDLTGYSDTDLHTVHALVLEHVANQEATVDRMRGCGDSDRGEPRHSPIQK